jgi:hypothetical protein
MAQTYAVRLFGWPQEVAMQKIRSPLQTFGDSKLRGLVERLRRNDLDLQERLAARVPTLQDPDMPLSDPLYQRLYFTLKDLNTQRAEAERELARRAAPA